jgi:hypothetical protein
MKRITVKFNNLPIIFPPSKKEKDELLFNQFRSLPDELKVLMAKFLDIKTIVNFCRSSINMNAKICNNDFFWKIKTQHDFKNIVDIPEESDDWKQTYKEIKDSEIHVYNSSGMKVGSVFLYNSSEEDKLSYNNN